nr:hypothetical protein [Tanacetum cinerariifolium]
VGKGFSEVETPLFENMLVVRVVDAEEEVQVPAQDDVVQEHVTEEINNDVVQPTPTSPLPSSPVIPSSPPRQSPSPPQTQAAEGSSQLFQQVLNTCSALVLRVEGLETANAAQQLEIIKLKDRVKKLERLNKVKSSKLRHLKKVGTSQRVESSEDVENVFNQGRKSVDMETDEGIELEVDQEKCAEEDTEVQEAVEVVTAAKLITEVVTVAATQIAAASTPIPTTKPAAKPKSLKIVGAPAVSTRKRKGVVIRDPEDELHTETPAETLTVKDKGKGILIEDPKPMKKKDQVEMDAEHARKLQEELDKENEESFKSIDWNVALDHIQSKEPQHIKRYHGIKKKPQSESEARKNMISYLRNTEGYKMEFFKGLKYDDILPIFQAKFDANMRFLFKTREEMEAEDEEIIKSINETPAQKAAKRRRLHEQAQEADDLKKKLEIFQDEDDDVFVEATPLAQKVPVVDYQLFLLVERRYPLSRFTLEQLVNVARLQVEEESEMSLELLREAVAERISNDSEEIARVLTSMDAATVLARGIDVPTGNGFIPTAGPPAADISTGSKVASTASPIVTAKEQQEKEDMRMNEQIARDAEVARIHAEEELQESTEKANDQDAEEGILYGYDQKQLRVEEEAPEMEKSTEEITEEKMKEMMQLVSVEDVYVQALQVKHLIIDWKQLDREDLNQLWALVKEYLSIRPATSEKEMKLWVELKRRYEPDPEDQLWTLTQKFMHAPVEWKLYDLSGVHHLTAKDKEIFMLVEKDYPFKKEGTSHCLKMNATIRRIEMPLPEVCTAIEEKKKKLPVKDRWQLH